MINSPAAKGSLLMSVARQAMIENGLQPDFTTASTSAIATKTLTAPSLAGSATVS